MSSSAPTSPTCPTWDRDRIIKDGDDCVRDPKVLKQEMTEVRRESVKLVRSLRLEQMPRGGLHPQVGRLTVEELLHEWVHHDGNHLRQALGNVQAYVWPNMGNARRFTQPEQ